MYTMPWRGCDPENRDYGGASVGIKIDGECGKEGERTVDDRLKTNSAKRRPSWILRRRSQVSRRRFPSSNRTDSTIQMDLSRLPGDRGCPRASKRTRKGPDTPPQLDAGSFRIILAATNPGGGFRLAIAFVHEHPRKLAVL